MEAIVKTNLELIVKVLSEIPEAKNNIYLIPALKRVLKNGDAVAWDDAFLELGRTLDNVRINKCRQSLKVMLPRLDNLMACDQILQSCFYIHRTWYKFPQSKEKIKQSVLERQTLNIAEAVKKLNLECK